MTEEHDVHAVLQACEALSHAAGHGRIEPLRRALADGADVNYLRTDISPLLMAVRGQHTPVVHLLLEHSANVNHKTRVGWSAAHEAAQLDRVDFLEAMRAAPVPLDPDIQDYTGTTPLHVAAKHNSLASAKALLAMGAQVNVLDFDHRTALLWAATSERPELVEFLLSQGANPLSQDLEGRSAADLAREVGWALGVSMLEQAARAAAKAAPVADVVSEAAPVLSVSEDPTAPTVSRIGKRPSPR